MTKDEIIKITNNVMEDSFELPQEDLKPEAHIFNDLGLDSLDIVDLVVALQKAFGVNIRNEEKVREIQTLQDVYNFIYSIKKSMEKK